MGDRASRRGAVDLGLPLMLVAFIAIGGFLYWLNMQAQAELAAKAAIAEEIAAEEAELAAMGDFISGETLQRDPSPFTGRVIAVEGLSIASLVGSQGFWLELPNNNPFLISLTEAVKAEGHTFSPGMTLTVSGTVYAMGDSMRGRLPDPSAKVTGWRRSLRRTSWRRRASSSTPNPAWTAGTDPRRI